MANNLFCQFCGGTEGHGEQVHTGDIESEGGWEDWFCCHACRDAGEPCETFHRIPKSDDIATHEAEALGDKGRSEA